MSLNIEHIVGHCTAEETLELFQRLWDAMSEDSKVTAVGQLVSTGLGDYVELVEE